MHEKEETNKPAEQVDASSFFYEKYVEDTEQIQQYLNEGKYFQGEIRTHELQKGRYRAYVSIPELKLDIQINGNKNINRAIEGDKVTVELLPVASWIHLSTQSNVFKFRPDQEGASEEQEYMNEAAVERRTVD